MTEATEVREAGLTAVVGSLAEYNETAEAARKRVGLRTSLDAGDPDVGWTVLQASPRPDEHPGGSDGYVSPQSELPGQVFLPEQLPDPEVAAAAGLHPQEIPAHLVTDDPLHLQGPELLEQLALDQRRKMREAVIEQVIGEPRPTAAADAGDESPSEGTTDSDSHRASRRRRVPAAGPDASAQPEPSA